MAPDIILVHLHLFKSSILSCSSECMRYTTHFWAHVIVSNLLCPSVAGLRGQAYPGPSNWITVSIYALWEDWEEGGGEEKGYMRRRRRGRHISLHFNSHHHIDLIMFCCVCLYRLISFSEFRTFESLLSTPDVISQLAFKVFDTDNKGRITFGKLQAWYKN